MSNLNEENKEKIKISGTYGDKVKLHLNGYVSTKYGDFLKIKSVDQVENFVYLYGHGDSGYDYSRISYSCKANEQSNKEYLEHLNNFFKRKGLRLNSIIKFKLNTDSSVETYKILGITYPTLKDEDYVPILIIENIKNNNSFGFVMNNFNEFIRINLVNVDFTPYTFEEKLENLLDDMCNIDGKIKDKDEYLKTLLELIQSEKLLNE